MVLKITLACYIWRIYNLAVGEYPVTATYNGNENFNVLTKETSFIVYQINTTLMLM